MLLPTGSRKARTIKLKRYIMHRIAIENKTVKKIEVLKNKDGSRLLVDGWLLMVIDLEDNRTIITSQQFAIPVVESYSYFWLDYIPLVAKVTDMEAWDIQYNLWGDVMENDLELAIV